MATFGKRGVVQPVSGSVKAKRDHQAHVVSEQLSAAAAVIGAGGLPAWTKVGPGQIVFSILLFAGILCFCFLPFAGDILRDHRLAGSWQPAYDMRVQGGSCTRYQFIATHCTAEIKSLSDAGRAPVAVGFLMGFTSGAGEFMIPVRSRIDPSAVTIAYAAETELANRTVTFLAFSGLLVLFIVMLSRQLLAGRYRGGSEHVKLVAGLQMFSELAELSTTSATGV